MSDRKWSALQQAIFAACADPNGGNLVVVARAGTGKTTTIIEALKHFAAHLSILLCAFNKKIQMELQKRIGTGNAFASTLHSVGLAAIKRYKRNVRIDANARERNLARTVCDRSVPDDISFLVGKLCTKGREILPLCEDATELEALAWDFDCVPDEEWKADGYDVRFVAERALAAMKVAAEHTDEIDFADMIYLPIRNKWLRPEYDVVIVDEAQDMTTAQLLIAKGVCKKNGRIMVVGDNRQAIYAFRGADSEALDNLKRELNAKELPLNVTYRCGKKIVEEAKRLVPDYVAHESNGDGEVSTMPMEKMLPVVEPGDFVLSRTNAALVAVAMKLLRAGKRARIEGRDIGAGLKALIKKIGTGSAKNSLPAFLTKLKNWEEREILRAQKESDFPDAKIERIVDKAETVRALADGLSGVPELIARIDSLFSDHDDNGNKAAFITCSTVHKAKGLEADRVFILIDTFKKSRKEGDKPMSTKRAQEEDNILYVAITRARNLLVYVTGAL